MIACCGLDCSKCEGYLATQEDNDVKRTEVAKKWSVQYNADIKPEHNGITAAPRKGIRLKLHYRDYFWCGPPHLSSLWRRDEDHQFITDPQLIRHILEHLGLWVQRPSRGPPSQEAFDQNGETVYEPFKPALNLIQ